MLLRFCTLIIIFCYLDGKSSAHSAEPETGPMVLDADKIENFEKENLVIASGNVQIDYNNRRVNADKITLNKLTEEVTAEGRAVSYTHLRAHET